MGALVAAGGEPVPYAAAATGAPEPSATPSAEPAGAPSPGPTAASATPSPSAPPAQPAPTAVPEPPAEPGPTAVPEPPTEPDPPAEPEPSAEEAPRGPATGTGASDPFGNLESVAAGLETVSVAGWAVDPDATEALYVWVTVDGEGRHLRASLRRPDVDAAYPAHRPDSGFAATIPVTPGWHDICVTVSNVGAGEHAVLGCAALEVPSGSPFGNFESMSEVAGGVRVTGWAVDPETADPVYLWVTIDGVGRHLLARGDRPDVARALPDHGPRHGFDSTLPAGPGPHRVCVTAANVGVGSHTNLGCRGMAPGTVAGGSPIGNFELAAGGPDGITVKGWAVDPDTVDPIYVWVTVDGGAGRHVLANGTRTDVSRAYDRTRPEHGFQRLLAVTPGSHRVCVTASNVGAGTHTALGCRNVTGSGGTIADDRFRVFTASDGVKGQYHVFASRIDPLRPVGLVVHFHGDGAWEFTHPDSTYSFGGSAGLRAEAASRNMVLLAAKTPDVTGSPTWWESGEAHAGYAAELIRDVVLERYDIDPGRIWLVGYSGGAQFITKFFLPAHASMLDGGGAVLFAGGGQPRVPVVPFTDGFVAGFPMHWYTGALDDGTCLHQRYNALRDAREGSAYYAGRGFRATLETPAGVCHNLSGRFGRVTGEQLDRHDAARR